MDVVEKMGRKAIKAAYEESKAPASEPLPAEEEIDLTDDDDDHDQDYVEQPKPKPPNPMLSRGLSSESLDLDAEPVRVGTILSGSSSMAVASNQRSPAVSPHSKRLREELSNGKLQQLEKSFLEGAAVAARQALKRSKKVQEERLMNAKQAERRRKRELEQEQTQSVSLDDLASVAMKFTGKPRRRKRARPLTLRDPEEGSTTSRNVRAEIKWKQKTEHFFEAQRSVLLPTQHKSNGENLAEKQDEVITVPATLSSEDAANGERSVFCVWERVKVGAVHFILGRLYIRNTTACELGLADGFSSKAAKVEKGQATLDIKVRGRGKAPLQARAITEICLGHIESKESHLTPLSLPLKYMTRVTRMREFLNGTLHEHIVQAKVTIR